MPFCAFCEGELSADLHIGRETLCPHCDGHLHACVQCRFYEPTLHNQCLEPEADYVGDRQKANFCEFFRLAGSRGAAAKGQGDRNEAARARPTKGAPDTRAADTGAPDTRAQDARAKLESLFKRMPKEEDEE